MRNGSRRGLHRPRKAPTLALVLFMLATGQVQPGDSETNATEVAKRVMAGSKGISSSLEFVRFEFVVEKEGEEISSRTHYWDAQKNRHRLERSEENGNKIVCLTDLPSRIGICSVGGKILFGEDARPHLEKSYQIWINDSYWLFMPYKMLDDGVHLRYEGETREDGKTYDKVMLTFDEGTGLTWNDRYWAYVNRDSGRMDYWEYLLQDEKGRPGKGAPSRWKWTDWADYGGVHLASKRISDDGMTRILFRKLAVFDSLPDVVFSKTQDVELP